MDLTDPETIDASFTATTPRRWGLLSLQLVLMGAVILTLLLSLAGSRWAVPDAVELTVPPAVLLIFLLTGWLAGRRRRIRRDALSTAWEHVQFEDPQAAQRELRKILRRPMYLPSDRGQAYLTLAAVCEQLGRFDSAGHVYENMLVQRVGDISQLQEAQIKLAGAKVRNDELTDAVTLIGRLAQIPLPPPFKAMFDLIRLFQRVFMGHYEDAVQDLDELRALFRRQLSTRAGLGYGLFAGAMHRLGRSVEAAKLWHDATVLVRPEKLVREYPLLRDVSEMYPAAESVV